MTIDELLESYRSAEISECDKGAKFERLMKNFLLTNPVYCGKFSDVWLWNEFPFRDELGTVDLGIDIVCKAVDGKFWAVQCKFYAETSTIDKAAVDTFLATSSKTFDADKKSSAADTTKIDGCKITGSKIIRDIFNALAEKKKNLLAVESRHVDGTQKSSEREKNLRWLKDTPKDGNACRILTNVRCLSEGVDVPSLDAVIFMSSKKSKVEIVQAVGRVMRKAQNKKYGYIIIPVVPLEKNPEDVLDTISYKTIWDILNALRAHDRRIDIFIEEIKLHKGNGGGKNPSDKIFVEINPA